MMKLMSFLSFQRVQSIYSLPLIFGPKHKQLYVIQLTLDLYDLHPILIEVRPVFPTQNSHSDSHLINHPYF